VQIFWDGGCTSRSRRIYALNGSCGRLSVLSGGVASLVLVLTGVTGLRGVVRSSRWLGRRPWPRSRGPPSCFEGSAAWR
jgi:hypothetical protein